VPTWRLAATAAGLAPVAGGLAWGGATFGLPWWTATLLASVALLALAGVDAARAVHPSRLSVTRTTPEVLRLADQGELVWRVTNPTARTARLRLADAVAPSLRATRRRAALVAPARGGAQAATALRPERRGRFAFGEVTVRVDGPWSLAARQATRVVAGTLAVYPPLRSRAVAEQRLGQARLTIGLRAASGPGEGTELESLRDYTRDDAFRHIDWAATARAGKPIVRTLRPERHQTVLVLVDSGRTMAGQLALPDGRARLSRGEPWTLPRLDHAMDAALALTRVATGLGDAVGLIAFADGVRAVVNPRGDSQQLRRVADALYRLEPVLAESDHRRAFGEALQRCPRRALLVVLTELAEEPMAATLLPALPLALRHHMVLVGGVSDPEVAAWARAVPAHADDAYRKAAATVALAERRRSAARLRRAGATVVDAAPDDLAGRLADAYIGVKRAGRL
jgi:uncharacterized protein (DUF58 family)